MRSGSRSLKSDHMILLAPPFGDWPANFNSVDVDPFRHARLLNEAQRLRAHVYLHDGAIRHHQLSADGRLVHSHDDQSWHLLVMSADGRVSGCARYCPQKEDVSFSELGIAASALAHCPSWGTRLRHAVESKRAEAKRRGYGYGELGGWALIKEMRHSREALRMSMNVCGLMRFLGGALAVSTATIRHRSSQILRKLGGHGLICGDVELPTYYDPQYECEMEILGFDTDRPNPKYAGWFQESHRKLDNLKVVCAGYCENWGMSTPAFQLEAFR